MAAGASTPPPRGLQHTPPTPMHGARHNSCEPSSPRRSARISNKQFTKSSEDSLAPTIHHPKKRPTFRRIPSQTFSPPSSPSSPAHQSRATYHSDHSDSDLPRDVSRRAHTISSNPALLPTPVKTPKKRVVRSNIHHASRVLFVNRDADDLMPKPKKSRRHYVPIEVGSFEAQPETADFAIYTDSKERMPEHDSSEDNPFLSKSKARKSRTSPLPSYAAARRAANPKYGMTKKVDEAVEHDKGMVYVFRGRKVFRKFDDVEDDELSARDNPDLDAVQYSAGSNTHFTRSSIKPRLLFPPEEQGHTDEEAATDIESQEAVVKSQGYISTPHRIRFQAGPATPPSTVKKASRSFRAAIDATHESRDDTEIPSAGSGFSTWKRTKPHTGRRAASLPVKRGPEDDIPQPMPAKRTRHSTASEQP